MKKIKYYAGFADSDGSFMLQPYKTKEGYVIRSKVSFSQTTSRDYILEPIVSEYGVTISRQERSDIRIGMTYKCSAISLVADNALRFMEQVKQHLVLKYGIVEYLLSVDGKVVTAEELKETRKHLKVLREDIKPSHKTKVSRQWMAGYLDGDGCIHSSFRKRDGNLEFKLTVSSNIFDPQGLELLHKNFKGCLIKQGNSMKWQVGLTKNNFESVLGHCLQHLVLKREQADYVVNILRKGLHKKFLGATWESNKDLHETLKRLKTRND